MCILIYYTLIFEMWLVFDLILMFKRRLDTDTKNTSLEIKNMETMLIDLNGRGDNKSKGNKYNNAPY